MKTKAEKLASRPNKIQKSVSKKHNNSSRTGLSLACEKGVPMSKTVSLREAWW